MVKRFLLAAAVTVVAGCGAEAKDPDKPAGDKNRQAMLDYAACMRENGIDMPDPTEGGSVAAIDPSKIDVEAFDAANETCMAELGEPPAPEGGTQTDEEVLESQLELAKCLREHGHDVQDPEPDMAMVVPDISPEVAKACGLGPGTSAQ